MGGMFDADTPEIQPLPPPVEETQAQERYTKTRLKQRKGRQSTILSTGNSKMGSKTVLG